MPVRATLTSIFEPELIKAIFQFGDVKRFQDGDVIMDYGKYVRAMPLITKGTVRVSRMDEQGKEILLYYLGSNESCSMAYSCCIEAKKSEVKAVAEGDVELIAIPHIKLDEWICKFPSWRNYILRSFNERFNELLKSIDAIAFENLDDRLVAYLKKKADIQGKSALLLSHQQIAEELGTNRVVISRLLKRLENDKKILLYRNEIKLLKGL